MKHFVYLLAILAVMFLASSTKAEHNDVLSKTDVQSVSGDPCQQVKKLLDTDVCVRQTMQYDVEIILPRLHKF